MKKTDSLGISLSRRQIVHGATAFAALCPTALLAQEQESIALADGPRPLVAYPGKRPLIRVTTRPPHLETPMPVFNEGILTPNDAFFVRYHLANIPTTVNASTHHVTVRGAVRSPLRLALAELKTLGEPIEIVAVNQCSGSSRGYSVPRVFGAQLGNGAMGNARWVGASLSSILRKAGVRSSAKHVVFDGLDRPVLTTTPDFRKSLAIEHALSGEPILAWQMNGEDLPLLNGYPVKLIVPGFFGTYWVKHVFDIEVIDHEFEGRDAYFMTTAYRVPDTDCQCVAPGTSAAKTRPISKLPVRSFITSLRDGAHAPLGQTVELRGIAFDGGSGVKTVDLSLDQGKTWRSAKLGDDLGKFSFREWRLPVTFDKKGSTSIIVRATNNMGEQQPIEATWNPSGYARHAAETTVVEVV